MTENKDIHYQLGISLEDDKSILMGQNFVPDCIIGDLDYEFPLQETTPNELNALIDGWIQRLKYVRCYTDIIKDEFVEEFAQFLIANQRKDTGHDFAEGSWTVPEDVVIGDGAGFDFALMPSYIAIAFLCYLKQDIPELAEKIEYIDDAIRKGLNYCALNNFQGNGYESTQVSLGAIEELALGKVFAYARKNPKISPEFLRAMRKSKDVINNKLKNNTGWGAIDKSRADFCLSLLVCDKEAEKRLYENLVVDVKNQREKG